MMNHGLADGRINFKMPNEYFSKKRVLINGTIKPTSL